MEKPNQKILFLAEVMNFFKSGSQYNNYMRANFKSRYLKTTLETFFEKTIHGRGLKCGSYFPLMSFLKLISGIFIAENGTIMVKISEACVPFRP